MSDTDPEAVIGSDEDDILDFQKSLKKKKKKKKKDKKKKTKAVEEDDEDANSDAEDEAADGYSYTDMLSRVFTLLREKHPELGDRKKTKMPPPQLVRVGTRKTMWANFDPACKVLHRQTDHVKSYVLAELGTEGSLDATNRLVVRGKYTQRHAEKLLKKYIQEYVVCQMCKNPETTLTRDPLTRLFFVQCESCGSRRSVAPIRSGFHATSRADRRAAKAAKA